MSGHRRRRSRTLRLVVLRRIERQVREKLPVLGDHPDVRALDEKRHALAVVGAPDTEVMKARPVAERHLPVEVDPVLPHADVRTYGDLRSGGSGFLAGVEGLDRGPTTQGAVGSEQVVVGDEPIDPHLEFLHRVRSFLLFPRSP